MEHGKYPCAAIGPSVYRAGDRGVLVALEAEMGSRLKWSKRNDLERARDFSQSNRTYLYSDIETKEPEMDRKWQMNLKQQLAALDALTPEQKKLVTLVYMRDKVTLERAISLVKGGKK